MIGFLLWLYPREKVAVLLELESIGTKFEGHAINKLNWKAVLKFELLSQIFEESTYLVNSVRVGLNHIKHQEDDDWESDGCHRRSNGKVH